MVIAGSDICVVNICILINDGAKGHRPWNLVLQIGTPASQCAQLSPVSQLLGLLQLLAATLTITTADSYLL